MERNITFRLILGLISITGLAVVYLFQHFNYMEFITGLSYSPNAVFAINRTIRFVINDLLVILLIYSLFMEPAHVKVAFIVQLFGLFLILPAYLYLKLTIEGDSEISSPLLSFLHRIIINPVLLILLIPAFYIRKFYN